MTIGTTEITPKTVRTVNPVQTTRFFGVKRLNYFTLPGISSSGGCRFESYMPTSKFKELR
jgi:hypothetical protein